MTFFHCVEGNSVKGNTRVLHVNELKNGIAKNRVGKSYLGDSGGNFCIMLDLK